MNILKWDKAFALDQVADDAELLQELLTIFKDSFKNDLRQMEEGLSEQASNKVCRAAHSIKGAAASLGITGIREVALAIEEESRGGGLGQARSQLPLLKSMQVELNKM
jgi:histidine phosphotransfer protein HptB